MSTKGMKRHQKKMRRMLREYGETPEPTIGMDEVLDIFAGGIERNRKLFDEELAAGRITPEGHARLVAGNVLEFF